MSNPLITLTNIGMRRDERTILTDINLKVMQGDFLAITGPNGGGKTTLLRIILRLVRPTTGNVEYFLPDGTPTDRLPIGYLPQKNMIDSRFPISVEETIASGLLNDRNLTPSERKKRIESILELIELDKHAQASIGNLSGGQLQRTLLGRALISHPEILILDEPLSYVDKQFEEHIYRIIADLAPSTTILLVSHEMSVISGMANRHLIVDRTIHECSAHHHFTPSECR